MDLFSFHVSLQNRRGSLQDPQCLRRAARHECFSFSGCVIEAWPGLSSATSSGSGEAGIVHLSEQIRTGSHSDTCPDSTARSIGIQSQLSSVHSAATPASQLQPRKGLWLPEGLEVALTGEPLPPLHSWPLLYFLSFLKLPGSDPSLSLFHQVTLIKKKKRPDLVTNKY